MTTVFWHLMFLNVVVMNIIDVLEFDNLVGRHCKSKTIKLIKHLPNISKSLIRPKIPNIIFFQIDIQCWINAQTKDLIWTCRHEDSSTWLGVASRNRFHFFEMPKAVSKTKQNKKFWLQKQNELYFCPVATPLNTHCWN